MTCILQVALWPLVALPGPRPGGGLTSAVRIGKQTSEAPAAERKSLLLVCPVAPLSSLKLFREAKINLRLNFGALARGAVSFHAAARKPVPVSSAATGTRETSIGSQSVAVRVTGLVLRFSTVL